MGRPHNDAARRIAQYRLSLDEGYCLCFSRAIVSAKVQGQLDFIRERLAADPMHRYPLTTCARRLSGMIEQIDAQDSIASRGLQERIGRATLPEGIQWTGLPAPLGAAPHINKA